MDDDAFANGGPSFFADLVRQGGEPVDNGFTDSDLQAIGPDHWADLVKNGGELIEE